MGYPLTADELANVKTVIGVGQELKADALPMLACLCIGSGENHWSTTGSNSSTGATGVFQLLPSTAAGTGLSPYDVAGCARWAFLRGFWSYPGLIEMARRYPSQTPGWLANVCQGAYSNLDTGAAYYDGYDDEADWLLKTYGSASYQPGLPGQGTIAPPSTPGTPPPKTVRIGSVEHLQAGEAIRRAWKPVADHGFNANANTFAQQLFVLQVGYVNHHGPLLGYPAPQPQF